MENGTYYIGTQLKLKVAITGEGFDQDSSTYTIKLKCGGEEKTYQRANITESEDEYFILVDTKDFAPGVMTATIIADVTDTEFTTRKEIYVLDVCCLRSVP